MTRTDGPATARAERPRIGALELRLYAVALLAAVYTVAWRAIGGHAPAPASAPAAAMEPPSREATPLVWIDRLPAETQPAIPLPAGWQRASAEPAAAPPTRIVRAPARRVPRVRTRSS